VIAALGDLVRQDGDSDVRKSGHRRRSPG
jgi:hypothetical protein